MWPYHPPRAHWAAEITLF